MTDTGEKIDPRELFLVPEDNALAPEDIGRRLINTLPELENLRDGNARIVYLLRAELKARGGKAVIGTAMLPRFQGSTKSLCDWLLACMFQGTPDFIILLDQTWWLGASPRDREILVFHELCHCVQATNGEGELKFNQEGNPVWTLVGHDVAEFNAVAARYGAWDSDITGFIAALREGGAI